MKPLLVLLASLLAVPALAQTRASGAADGRARAVSPSDYGPTDGAVLGRVLTVEGERPGRPGQAVVALVGVDEAAALRAVVARQQTELDALRAEVRAIREALALRPADAALSSRHRAD